MIEGILKKYPQHGLQAPPGWSASAPAASAPIAPAPTAGAASAFGQVRVGHYFSMCVYEYCSAEGDCACARVCVFYVNLVCVCVCVLVSSSHWSLGSAELKSLSRTPPPRPLRFLV